MSEPNKQQERAAALSALDKILQEASGPSGGWLIGPHQVYERMAEALAAQPEPRRHCGLPIDAMEGMSCNLPEGHLGMHLFLVVHREYEAAHRPATTPIEQPSIVNRKLEPFDEGKYVKGEVINSGALDFAVLGLDNKPISLSVATPSTEPTPETVESYAARGLDSTLTPQYEPTPPVDVVLYMVMGQIVTYCECVKLGVKSIAEISIPSESAMALEALVGKEGCLCELRPLAEGRSTMFIFTDHRYLEALDALPEGEAGSVEAGKLFGYVTPPVEEGPFRTVGIIISIEKYNAYHKLVVDAAVAMTDESMREFFDGCSYEEAFIVGRRPEEEAEGNVEALDG